ncbi:hypothetical protein [Streptomyces sp. NPDC102476]|uniref:hypothetical protein n=1 Tax=Streptomyces sp. NPDC102476 TaxID=3366181 RepID=UPI0037FBC85D
MADGPVAERGMLTAPEELWDAAVRQAEVIGPLAEKDTVGLADADEAAAMLPRWSAPSPQNAPPTPAPLPKQPAAVSADPSRTPPTRSSTRDRG